MQIVARDQLVDGQTTIEMAGSELPSALGDHLIVWINEATYLHLQARSVDSLPDSLAPSGRSRDRHRLSVGPSDRHQPRSTDSEHPAGFAEFAGPRLRLRLLLRYWG
jgi:hypothetical protein